MQFGSEFVVSMNKGFEHSGLGFEDMTPIARIKGKRTWKITWNFQVVSHNRRFPI